MTEPSATESPKNWEELVEAFAEGRLPILETIKAVRPLIYEKGDHEGFVNFTRSMHMMMRDVRLLKRMRDEMDAEMVRVTGKKYTQSDFDRLIRSKDGPRLMEKHGAVRSEMFRDGPPLRDHRKKHFMGVISGAVVNSRLDRVLGSKSIKEVLQDAESGKLETLRQSCLYIDLRDGHPTRPDDVIAQDTAKFFAVLAGELWAEILGHFPWEFEAMLEKVIKFELEIGFAPEIVRRNASEEYAPREVP